MGLLLESQLLCVSRIAKPFQKQEHTWAGQSVLLLGRMNKFDSESYMIIAILNFCTRTTVQNQYKQFGRVKRHCCYKSSLSLVVIRLKQSLMLFVLCICSLFLTANYLSVLMTDVLASDFHYSITLTQNAK